MAKMYSLSPKMHDADGLIEPYVFEYNAQRRTAPLLIGATDPTKKKTEREALFLQFVEMENILRYTDNAFESNAATLLDHTYVKNDPKNKTVQMFVDQEALMHKNPSIAMAVQHSNNIHCIVKKEIEKHQAPARANSMRLVHAG